MLKEFDSYNQEAPQIDNHEYLGYIINNEALQEGNPVLFEVEEDTTIYFVYKEIINSSPNEEQDNNPHTGIVLRESQMLLIMSVALIILGSLWIKRKSRKI